MPRGIFTVKSNPVKGREDEYHAWYGRHIEEVLAIPGFVAARRYRLVGDDDGNDGHYLAVYDLEADDLAGVVAELRSRSEGGHLETTEARSAATPPDARLYESID